MVDPLTISGVELKCARILLGWNVELVARYAGVGAAAVYAAEHDLAVAEQRRRAIVRALESGGIEFIPHGLRKRPSAGAAVSEELAIA
ncbi:MAG TPA: hypothetical protein VMU69_22745 [Bradyrhizobium sp.]|nr:hypothetical protein [Bradyrhizobium sp.]